MVPQPDGMIPVFSQQVASPDTKRFVAVNGTTVVGFVSVRLAQPSPTPGVLRPRSSAWFAIAVSPEYRRRGIGRRLMRAAERWARSQGVVDLLLDCQAANTPAVRFCEKIGYRVRGLILAKCGITTGQEAAATQADGDQRALPEPGQMDRDRCDERAVVSMRNPKRRVRS